MKGIIWAGILAGTLAAGTRAHPNPPSSFVETAKPYGPYEFLIGDWYGKLSDTTIHEQFRWGPDKSYIFFSTYMSAEGTPEQLHFEGMAVWNGKTGALDYLVAVEPGSGTQEKGVFHVGPDGTIVREVEFTGSSGKTGQFRQTFRGGGPDTLTTSVLRRTATGWEATFPGSEKIVMVRRPETASR